MTNKSIAQPNKVDQPRNKFPNLNITSGRVFPSIEEVFKGPTPEEILQSSSDLSQRIFSLGKRVYELEAQLPPWAQRFANDLFLQQTVQEALQLERPSLTSVAVSKALEAFFESKPPGETRDRFYKVYLPKAIPELGLTPKPSEISSFENRLKCKAGGKAAYHRAMRAFYNWLYSPASGFGFKREDNPVRWVKPPPLDRKIMPAQDEKSLVVLLSHVDNTRDRAILSVLIDSSGRLSEVSNINEPDILWDKHIIKATAKGGGEVLMPFSSATETLLRDWFTEYHPNGGSIWGINKAGIVSMLRRLEKKSGIKCNAHTFRRGFASILRRRGVGDLDIMKLGHWKSLGMVQRYTESVSFEDSLNHYKAPMERLADATDGLPKKAKCRGPESNW